MRPVLLAVVAAVTAGCGTPCGDGVDTAMFTLTSGDMTVQVTTKPYSLTVIDSTGKTVASAGKIGWATGTFGIGKALYNGYYFFEPHFDDWRQDMTVVAATQKDGELDVTLRASDDTCVTITHTIRAGALRVEAHAGIMPRAWQIGFASP